MKVGDIVVCIKKHIWSHEFQTGGSYGVEDGDYFTVTDISFGYYYLNNNKKSDNVSYGYNFDPKKKTFYVFDYKDYFITLKEYRKKKLKEINNIG